MGLQPSSGHFQRFMEDALQRHNLLYTGEHAKKRNPNTGLLEGHGQHAEMPKEMSEQAWQREREQAQLQAETASDHKRECDREQEVVSYAETQESHRLASYFTLDRIRVAHPPLASPA